MTDWTPEEDEAFNDVEKNSNLGKQILRDMGQPYVYAPKREWVGLTDDEQLEIYKQHNMDGWGSFYNAIEAKLKEKNT
jgi:hypothetical protein